MKLERYSTVLVFSSEDKEFETLTFTIFDWVSASYYKKWHEDLLKENTEHRVLKIAYAIDDVLQFIFHGILGDFSYLPPYSEDNNLYEDVAWYYLHEEVPNKIYNVINELIAEVNLEKIEMD